MARPDDLIAALRRHGREVQSLQSEHAAEFLRLARQLKERLAGRIAALGTGMRRDSLDVWTLRRIEAETRVEIAALSEQARGLYDRASAEATELAIEHLQDEIGRLTRALDGKAAQVSLDAAKTLAEPERGLLANSFDTSVQRYGLDALNAVRRELFIGLRAGDSTRDIASRVAATQGPVAAATTGNAERLVRTELNNAYGMAQWRALEVAQKRDPLLLKMWHHAGSYPCPTCVPLHGTVRPLKATWMIRQGKRTRSVEHPPAHPNCTCRLLPMKSKWSKQIDQRALSEHIRGGDKPSVVGGIEDADRLLNRKAS